MCTRAPVHACACVRACAHGHAQVKFFEDDLEAKRAAYEADKRNYDCGAFVEIDDDNDGKVQCHRRSDARDGGFGPTCTWHWALWTSQTR